MIAPVEQTEPRRHEDTKFLQKLFFFVSLCLRGSVVVVRKCRNVAIILLLSASVIAISAHAPSNTYSYAQLWQAGATIGMIESGNWLLPRNQAGGLMRKPQLYSWLDAPILLATGIYDDITFRLPSVVAMLAMSLCVYFLSLRWYNSRVALLAACLWAIAAHMGKLSYLGTTDMLFTLWITLSVMCLDRLTFHPAPKSRQIYWAMGLWVTMILGGLTKGWGLVNISLVGGFVVLAATFGPGFKSVRAAKRMGDAPLLIVRLVLRRWWSAIKALRLWWGLTVFIAVIAAVLIAMARQSGHEFGKLLGFEIFQRITGSGRHPPAPSSVPPILCLIYYLLPVSIFAIGSALLVKPRRWFTRKNPVFLPLCWIVAVVVPFSLAHGFRPDYLLPCYAPAAMMAAWAIVALDGRRGAAGIVARWMRHAWAAIPITIATALVLVPLIYLFHSHMPVWLAELMPIPFYVNPESWWILHLLVAAGFAIGIWSVMASLKWRIRQLAAAACIGMLGVIFLSTHFISRHARTGDGEKMRDFTQLAYKYIGSDKVATYWTDKLCVRVYLGRFGPALARPDAAVKSLPNELYFHELLPNGVRWLITCDRGLVEMGQARLDPKGHYKLKAMGKNWSFTTLAQQISEYPVIYSPPIRSQRWGRLCLIKIKKNAHLHTKPFLLGYVPGGQDE